MKKQHKIIQIVSLSGDGESAGIYGLSDHGYLYKLVIEEDWDEECETLLIITSKKWVPFIDSPTEE